MAPEARLEAYGWGYDEEGMTRAAQNGMFLSNHSYGVIRGWEKDFKCGANVEGEWTWHGDISVSEVEDYNFGFYNEVARDWDSILYEARRFLTVVSAGNGRKLMPARRDHWIFVDGECRSSNVLRSPNGGDYGFDTLPGNQQVCKNALVVGAVADIVGGYKNQADVKVLDCSGNGPTDDGRIKPDIVANGDAVYSTIVVGTPPYGYMSDTSMAAPSVTGSIALLHQHYFETHGAETPLAATVKALVIHTADEAGTSPGPDYRHGWGLMNTHKAVEVISRDAQDSTVIQELILNQGSKYELVISAKPNMSIKATIAWTDPPGTPLEPQLNPRTPMLVNDLDLRIIHQSGKIDYPWYLNVEAPQVAAIRKDNSVDNVEQVFIENPGLGDYVVAVTHKGTLFSGSQALSLIVTQDFVTSADDQFAQITSGSIVNDGGASRNGNWVDYDNDGYIDLFVTNSLNQKNFLYRNRTDGTFTKITSGPVVSDEEYSWRSSWGDYDNDGYSDLFVANIRGLNNSLYHNNGDGTFTKVTSGAIVNEGGVSEHGSWADYDNDGALDLFVANWYGQRNFLYHNNGDGTFSKVTSGAITKDGGNSITGEWADYDGDNDLDLFVANANNQNNFLYRNNGDGTFTKVTSGPIVNEGGSSVTGSWGDYNNDGHLDLFVANNFQQNNFLYQNNGNGTFIKITSGPLVNDHAESVSAGWADYDNDGDLDLFVSNSYGENDFLYRNDSHGVFLQITSSVLVRDQKHTVGIAWGDHDNDGSLDLFVPNNDGNNFLYHNKGSSNNWINIKCVGRVSNASAFGAVVRIKSAINGSTVRQMRYLPDGNSNHSQNVEFGLGNAAVIDSIKIEWPSGIVDVYANVAVNDFYTAIEGRGLNPATSVDALATDSPFDFNLNQNYPNPFNPATTIEYSLDKASNVTLRIYDLLGREVKTLITKNQPSGKYTITWDGSDKVGIKVPSGLYFYKLETGDKVEVRKMLLAR